MRIVAAMIGLCLLSLLLTPTHVAAHGSSSDGDALIAPPPPPTLSSDDSIQRGPSQYMAGSVAVRVVLPESDGSVDASTENWTPAQVEQVRGQVQAALDWWTAQLPLARLHFTMRLEVVSTAYEPITYGLADEGRWIGDLFQRMGFAGSSYFDQSYAAGYDLRDELDTDWTTTIFVVNSEQHGNGYFADGHFAYAYINGPFMVVTSDGGSYGSDGLAPVVAHELGHIFGALDQYAAARVSCTRNSGYLDLPTSNSQFGGCGTNVPSIMLEPNGAYQAGLIDPSAQGQIGYRDSDGDGLIDPLDTTPTIELNELTMASLTGRPVISGRSRDPGLAVRFHQPVSINWITAVEYRVNGGPWQQTTATDGAFNSTDEAFRAELPLYNGEYLLEIRARNAADVASEASTISLVVDWIGPQPAYSASAPAVTASNSVTLQLAAPATTQAMQISASPTFRDVPWQAYQAQYQFHLQSDEGTQIVYVRFRDPSGLDSLAYALPIQHDTQPPEGSVFRDAYDPLMLLMQAHDAGTGVSEIELQIGDSTPQWMPFQQTVQLGSLHLLAFDADAPVTVRFRDAAGNVSAPQTATNRYLLSLPMLLH